MMTFNVTSFYELCSTTLEENMQQTLSCVYAASWHNCFLSKLPNIIPVHGLVEPLSIFSPTRHLAMTRSGSKNIPTGKLTRPTRGLKYGAQGTINARNHQKIAFHLPTGGLASSDGGLWPSLKKSFSLVAKLASIFYYRK